MNRLLDDLIVPLEMLYHFSTQYFYATGTDRPFRVWFVGLENTFDRHDTLICRVSHRILVQFEISHHTHATIFNDSTSSVASNDSAYDSNPYWSQTAVGFIVFFPLDVRDLITFTVNFFIEYPDETVIVSSSGRKFEFDRQLDPLSSKAQRSSLSRLRQPTHLLGSTISKGCPGM